jgi:uncharacterized protein
MSFYYLDASALGKHLLSETGSVWVNQRFDSLAQHLLASSALCAVEVVSALARAHREKRISQLRRDIALDQVREEMGYRVRSIHVSEGIVGLASELAVTYNLRAYDAIHLATAVQLRSQLVNAGLPAPVFVSADIKLLSAARAERFETENPNDHP